jgi:polysaccharide biosynthesis transport protein
MNAEEQSIEPLPTGGGKLARPTANVGQLIRKYWPTMVATFIAVVAVTMFSTLGQTKIYQAEATIMLDPNPPRPLGSRIENVVDMGAGNFWGNQEYFETQYRIIRSRRVALAVVNEMGLGNDLAFLQNLPPDAQPRPGRTVSPELAAEELRGRLEVQPIRDSRLATVLLKDANPERARRLLSALLDAYVSQNLEAALEQTSSATDWLRGQLDTLNTDLRSSEEALHNYKKQNDILSVAFDEKSSILSDQIKALSSELTRVKAQLEEASARKSVLDAAPESDPQIIQSPELMKSPLLGLLRGEYTRSVAERDALVASGKGPNHDTVLAAQAKIKVAEAAIQKEIRNVKRSTGGEVAALSRQAGGIQAIIKKATDQAQELNLREIEYNRLRRSKDNTEKLYSMVLERTKEADLAQMMRVNNISIVDRPLLPRVPVSPKVMLNLTAGIFAGFILGIAAAFLRSLLDRTIKVPADLENDLTLTFIGLLPQFGHKGFGYGYGYGPKRPKRVRGKAVPDGKPELAVHDQPTGSVAEASRSIRTNLLFMSPDKPPRMLLVTSAGPGEGKTTVASCIAVAMAQTGQRVLLVDCDLRRPRLHRIFGTGTEAGVTTVLLDGNLDVAVKPTQVPNLSVLPSGPIPPNPAELLHTDRFKQMLQDLGDRFDRVIIDSPPVVAVTDPAILSRLVDGTVMVVRAFKTRKEVARHAVRSIVDVGGNLLGGVLNAIDFAKLEYKYSYYYSNATKYYTSETSPSSSKPKASADDSSESRDSAGL